MSNLKKYRLENGLSQTELGCAVGVSARYIAFLENGDRKPSIGLAFRIANRLNKLVDDIFLPSDCTKCTVYKENTGAKEDS